MAEVPALVDGFLRALCAIANGMLYINSGYGALGGRPGNVLLAFGVD